MTAALGDDFDTAAVHTYCQQYRQVFRQENGCDPSARAISLAGRCQGLPLCTEAEVRLLLQADPLNTDACSVSADFEAVESTGTENAARATELTAVEAIHEELVMKYLDTVYDIDDCQQLPPDELIRVRAKFTSLFRFLRLLNDARDSVANNVETIEAVL